MQTTTTTPDFSVIKAAAKEKFDTMLRMVCATAPMFAVEYDRDEIWQVYLNGFPEEERQEHNCSCCRSFIRQIGAAVAMTVDLKLVSVWDRDSLSGGVRALAEYIESRPIAGLFFHEEATGGTDKSPDPKRGVVWEHFFVRIPKEMQNKANGANTLGRKSAELRETRNVLRRGLEEITEGAIKTAKELIAQNSLYRGNEFEHMLDKFAYIRASYKDASEDVRERLTWAIAAREPENVCRIRNTAFGTLLIDLSAGETLNDAEYSLEAAVRSYEQKVAPTNYRRPTALVTPRMVEQAKERLEALGLISALQRRRLDDRDLTVANALFVYRPTTQVKDVFAELARASPANMRELKKVESISIADFLEKVVPTAKDIKVLVERKHMPNFVTLTGAVDPEANNLMKWDNSFGWSYTGGVADSIKERVKAAGGDVTGWMRASLAWSNYDDLDLHFTSKTEHVYFAHKRGKAAWLDVDMNAGGGTTRTPVENITFEKELPPGDYEIAVNQFAMREKTNTGYDLEIEVNGETHSFGSAQSPKNSAFDRYKFKVLADGQVTFDNPGTSTRISGGSTKWGVTTGQFVRVRAITLSPNHWTKPISNKHFMFLLEGCVSDESTRPFYNEFLVDALAVDRKTTEALAGKIEVLPATGAELSGLGFSDSQRNEIYVEVTGEFKRTVKVTF